LGALNLYATRPGLLEQATLERALTYAAEAAHGMVLQRHVETMRNAVNGRQTISQAIRIVMERYGLDKDRAFQYLVRVSQSSNLKLRVIARELVEQAEFPAQN
jgi:AmiR/NasT family two-component response regulator